MELTKELAHQMLQSGNKLLIEAARKAFPKEFDWLPDDWHALETISGYRIADLGIISEVSDGIACTSNQTIFKTTQQAQAVIALAQLTQLRHAWRNGWEPDWLNIDQEKHCIVLAMRLSDCSYIILRTYTEPHFLAFPSRQIAERFLQAPAITQLLEEYKFLLL